MKSAYNSEASEIANELESDLAVGLSAHRAEELLQIHGENMIELQEGASFWSLFLGQFKNPLVIMLLITVVIAAAIGEKLEAILITGIVVFMSIIGAYLEYGAGKALSKIKTFLASSIRVVRAGKVVILDVTKLVPGDIIMLAEGDKVPADARLIQVNDLKIDESLLTGESLAVTKNTEIIEGEVVLGDQINMLFNGTMAIEGEGRAIVVATGIRTEIGKIAQKLAQTDTTETPLQIQLSQLSKILIYGTLVFSTFVFIFSGLRGTPLIDALLQSLALAIAFVPEGLTAVMTVTLAIGVKEMVAKKVIIKRLLAAEGLGSVSILATDKTGTITEGVMSVEKLWMYAKEFAKEEFAANNGVEHKMIEIIKYCNNKKGATELALVNFLEENGLEFELEEREIEHRFSSSLKRMTVVKSLGDKLHAFSKGAPDVLLPMCQSYYDYEKDKTFELSATIAQEIAAQIDNYASAGYRVLLLATKELEKKSDIGARENTEQALVFVGIICLIDPLRAEVRETVAKLKMAGIRPIMITGDHKLIAKTIALQAGMIDSSADRVKVGTEIAEYFANNSDLSKEDIVNCSVFARVNPEHKEMLIELFKSENLISAMAGDGVNDAIAISKADIGIAVINGTDVVKEAADVVLTGEYSALASAVEVGRVILERTRLYLHYILSGNFCEVGVFILTLIFGLPLPLTAISLLVINLLTDAAPAMAMAVEKGDDDLMLRKPRAHNEGIINKQIWRSIGIQGVVSSVFLFIVFWQYLKVDLAVAQTAAFTAYIFQKLLRGFTARSLTKSVIEYGFLSNKYMLVALFSSLLVWYLIVFVWPITFGMAALTLKQVLPIFVASLMLPLLEELLKYYQRRSLQVLAP